MFSHLNDISICLQGCDVTVCEVKDELAGLTAQVSIWKAKIESESFDSFLLPDKYLAMINIQLLTHAKNT